jgi:cysteine-rich repeat protein
MKNLLSCIGLCLGLTMSLSACELYLGEHHGREPRDGGDWVECRNDGAYRCNLDGCYWLSTTCPDQPGYECKSSADCASGCYCSAAGTCVEGGFCATDADCGAGFTCNEERSACEPDTNLCINDQDCAAGEQCDVRTNTCVAKPPVAVCGDAVRNPGEACDDGNRVDGDGCSKDCSSTEICGNGVLDVTKGEQCDDGNRVDGDGCNNTCKTSGPISCAGAITCMTAPPACQNNAVPLIQDGCYTGVCKLIAECDAPPACKSLRLEADCTVRADCEAVYNGINCRRPDGSACRAGEATCVCDSFRFASCETAAP